MLLNLHKCYDRSDTALYKADNVLTAEEDVYADQARVAGAGIDPRMELESAGASLTVNWTLVPRLSLNSIRAHEHFTPLHAEAPDGPSHVFHDGPSDEPTDQYSQDRRVATEPDRPMLIVGPLT